VRCPCWARGARTLHPVESAAKTRSPTLLSAMSLSPVDSTLKDLDPAKPVAPELGD
jgi:hypothetical protein